MILTSYFGSSKWTNLNAISIAKKTPVTGIPVYFPLTPTWEMVMEFKRTGDEQKYTQIYNQILSTLNPHNVAKELDGKVLLCYEKTGKFCHRHLVAAWLKSFGYEVAEL